MGNNGKRRKLWLSFVFVLTLSPYYIIGNDDVFDSAEGGQLVPIKETNISLKKEILTIRKRPASKRAYVSVYYELFNPGRERDLIVGFEIDGNSENGTSYPYKKGHPHLHRFTVNGNGKPLVYKITYQPHNEDFSYDVVRRNLSETVNLRELNTLLNQGLFSMTYVYYFKMRFKKGRNIIRHNYQYYFGGDIAVFDYKLTPANFWGNNQIDDFTLIVDIGKKVKVKYLSLLQDSMIDNFSFSGKGHISDLNDDNERIIYIEHGKLVFNKKNFHPDTDIYFSLE